MKNMMLSAKLTVCWAAGTGKWRWDLWNGARDLGGGYEADRDEAQRKAWELLIDTMTAGNLRWEDHQ